jgi:hypothetical protein
MENFQEKHKSQSKIESITDMKVGISELKRLHIIYEPRIKKNTPSFDYFVV